MASKTWFLLTAYLAAFIAANLLVKHFGPYGLIISSFVLIPFDFVCRTIFHEKWGGKEVFWKLLSLTLVAGALTIGINYDATNIALASFGGFCAAQLFAGIFYQLNKMKKSWFYKVNVSDLIAIISDSLVFQIIAFSSLNFIVTGGQILIKFVGGVLWYYILFVRMKIYKKL